jgi:hypothetical protein
MPTEGVRSKDGDDPLHHIVAPLPQWGRNYLLLRPPGLWPVVIGSGFLGSGFRGSSA